MFEFYHFCELGKRSQVLDVQTELKVTLEAYLLPFCQLRNMYDIDIIII